MPKPPTGAICTYEALRFDLSALQRSFLRPGFRSEGVFTWQSKWRSEKVGREFASVKLYAMLMPDSSYGMVEMGYRDGETVHHDAIKLVGVPSNLGKGMVLYFLCPETGRRCRSLYRCYGSPIWKSRQAYSRRIYYECQHSSKRDHALDRWSELEYRLPKLRTPHRHCTTYQGKPTRRAQRVDRLSRKRDHFNKRRWEVFTQFEVKYGHVYG